MLYTFIRDSFGGRSLYHLSKGKLFTYKEEEPGYDAAAKYTSFSAGKTRKENHILVDWEGPEDPDNPHNWPLFSKALFLSLIMTLTASVYMASAVYTPGVDKIMREFKVGHVVSLLPLTLFVIGYAVGPILFAPMSEKTHCGRSSIYISSLFLFVVLQVPTALVKNIAGLCILRFLAGFFGSPALAVGGGSIGDVINLPWLPVGISAWSFSCCIGPSMGPLIGSVFTQVFDWRWTFWIQMIITGVVFMCLAFFLPETYGPMLLSRKADRLRRLTGNVMITSRGELDNQNLSFKDLALTTVWRPLEITIMEPVVLLIDLYIALVYAILYLWFEAFPITFGGIYRFNTIETGLCYLSIVVGSFIGWMTYIPLIYYRFTKRVQSNRVLFPEVFIPPTIIGATTMPLGMFIFGWTASENIHWMGPIVGATVYSFGMFFCFQGLLNYLGMSFSRFMASAFASNDLFRSLVGGAFPLFGVPLYNNLATRKFPVAWGSSVLGFISVVMILIPVLFHVNGPKLRARSKYTGDGEEDKNEPQYWCL